MLRVINEIPSAELKGKKVFLRVDWNVPIKNGAVAETLRLDRSLPTIQYLQQVGAKIIIASHLSDPKASLQPMIDYVGQKVNLSGVTILPNLRTKKGEVKNDLKLSKEWAELADIYVNDAFSASHREHASVVGLPKLLPSYAGISLAAEVVALSAAFKPVKPLLVIVAGAKFESKLPVLEKFLPLAEHIFIGGALANLFLKREGYEIGQSFVDPQPPSITTLLRNGKVVIPEDVVVERAGELKEVLIDEVKSQDKIIDAGSATLKHLQELIKDANFIIWNGPLGVYEQGGDKGTAQLVKLLTARQTHTIIGGGDTIAAMDPTLTNYPHFFISTGGGAMLQFLATGTLPGIQALENSKN